MKNFLRIVLIIDILYYYILLFKFYKYFKIEKILIIQIIVYKYVKNIHNLK